jgi:hypothetical protein
MNPMYITDSLFRRKRKLNDFLDDSSDTESTDSSDGSESIYSSDSSESTRSSSDSSKSTDSSDSSIIQSHQNDVPSKLRLIIHSQLPSIELVSPVYACVGARCHLSSCHKIDTDSTAKIDFNINFPWREPIGILMYKLKNTRQFNKDAISSEDEAKCTQLLITWEVNKSKELCVISCLIEHDKGYIWNRYSLMKLAKYFKLYDIHHGTIENTYLMHNNTVLMTRENVTRERTRYKLEMTISETSMKDDTMRLWYFDMKR